MIALDYFYYNYNLCIIFYKVFTLELCGSNLAISFNT